MVLRQGVIAGLLALALTGCGTDQGPKQGLGTVTGGIAGGLIGAQFGSGTGKLIATGFGASLGALIGNDIGKSLDERDQQLAAQAEFDALETGTAGTERAWRGPSGHYGSVTPGTPYAVNQYTCRDFTHKVFIDSKPETVRGTACRQPDGTWRPLS